MTTIRTLTLGHSTMKEQNIRRQDFHWGYEIAVSSSLGDYTFTALAGYTYEENHKTPVRFYAQKTGWIQLPLGLAAVEGLDEAELDRLLNTLRDVCRKEVDGWEFYRSLLPEGEWVEKVRDYYSRQRHLEVYQQVGKINHTLIMTEISQEEAVKAYLQVRLGRGGDKDQYNFVLAKRFAVIESQKEMKALLLEAREEAEIQLEEILDAVKNVPVNN